MKHTLTSLAATIAAQDAEIRALREEGAKLRERVAVLESKQQVARVPALDWTNLRVGTPQWVNPAPDASPYVPHTVWAAADHLSPG